MVSTGTPFFLKCGSEANVTFMGPPGGGQVVRAFHQSTLPPECSGQSQAMVTGLITDDVFMPGGITSILIEPPSPINWNWLCTESQWGTPGSVPRTVNSSGVAVYGVEWQEEPGYGPLTTSCVTNDPILDLIAARQLLDSLWKLSGATGPDSLKKEFGGYLFADSTAVVTFRISPSNPLDSACHNDNVPTTPYPGTAIASIHVHPFGHRESTTVCHPWDTTKGYDSKIFKVFSRDDLDSRLGNDAIFFGPAFQGMYVMDKKNIAFGPVGTTTNNVKTKAVSRTRVNSSMGCQIA
jgi:hypothetical protein